MSEAGETTLFDRIAKALRFSMAGYVAISVGVSLIVLTLIAWIVFHAEPQRVAWGDYLQWPQLLLLAALWGSSCFLAYWTVRLWNEDLPARDRELEEGWQAGIATVGKRGLSIADLPLFIVLGCREEESQRRFLKQTGLKLTSEPLPLSPTAPIRWFIGEDRILLFCNEAGTLSPTQSRLALHRRDELANEERAELEWLDAEPIRAMQDQLSATLGNENRNQTWIRKRERIAHLRQGLQSQRSSIGSRSLQQSSPHQSGNTGTKTIATGNSIDGTVDGSSKDLDRMLESLDATEELLAGLAPVEKRGSEPRTDLVRRRQHSTSILSSSEIILHQSLMEDTCRRLRVGRGNMAPINGIIAWIDGPQLMDCSRFASQMGQALRRDSNQIQEQLGIIAPLTIVLDRMHEMDGFSELIRRTGPEGSSKIAMGEAFEWHRQPELGSIVELCLRSLRAINQSVYRCFQTAGGINQPGNHRLFELVIACRGKLGQALQSFLIESVAIDSRMTPSNEAAMISGVYFTASGEKATLQGFSYTVLERMMEQQELLSWTRQKRSQDSTYRLLNYLLGGVCFVLLITLLGQLILAIGYR